MTVQWDYYTAQLHPEWLSVSADGCRVGWNKYYEPGFYDVMCVNSPYRNMIKEITEELFETMPAVDGLFYDIVWPADCSCRYCRAGMKNAGLDPLQEKERLGYAYDVMTDFILDMSGYVRQFSDDCSIYYNNARIGPNRREPLPGFTHLEFDALPGGGPDGYKWLRTRGRFERNLGVDCVAQTGKFQTSWGDFHSFKNLSSLQYECFQALSLNCKCLIGDQLLPSGKLETAAYHLVGKVYGAVEAKEPWCRDAKAVTDIAVLASASLPSMNGAVGMLVEAGQQFDVIDNGMDFSPYEVLILPDHIEADDDLAAKIDEYVAAGGKLLASFESGMNRDKTAFLPKCLPVAFSGDGPIYTDGLPVRGRELGRNEYSDFIIPSGSIGEGLPETEHVMYTKGVEVVAAEGAEVLTAVVEPVFNRTWEHFCSHRHSPSSGQTSYPAVVRRGDVIYFGHAVFDLYASFAPMWVKKMVLNALKILLPETVLTHDGPSTLEATVNAQDAEGRWVVHLLHYVPLNRAKRLSVIEETIPLFNTRISVKVPKTVQSVVCVPQEEPLAFEQKGDRVEFSLPKLEGHQMIAVNW